ncbi:hypothetical protein OF83DRAFT_1294246 [Amylostereum chailletii]|nr:hypothetical protein OF83DRAFT_1294246 [Amylostereum chailletii]
MPKEDIVLVADIPFATEVIHLSDSETHRRWRDEPFSRTSKEMQEFLAKRVNDSYALPGLVDIPEVAFAAAPLDSRPHGRNNDPTLGKYLAQHRGSAKIHFRVDRVIRESIIRRPASKKKKDKKKGKQVDSPEALANDTPSDAVENPSGAPSDIGDASSEASSDIGEPPFEAPAVPVGGPSGSTSGDATAALRAIMRDMEIRFEKYEKDARVAREKYEEDARVARKKQEETDAALRKHKEDARVAREETDAALRKHEEDARVAREETDAALRKHEEDARVAREKQEKTDAALKKTDVALRKTEESARVAREKREKAEAAIKALEKKNAKMETELKRVGGEGTKTKDELQTTRIELQAAQGKLQSLEKRVKLITREQEEQRRDHLTLVSACSVDDRKAMIILYRRILLDIGRAIVMETLFEQGLGTRWQDFCETKGFATLEGFIAQTLPLCTKKGVHLSSDTLKEIWWSHMRVLGNEFAHGEEMHKSHLDQAIWVSNNTPKERKALKEIFNARYHREPKL